MHKWSSQKIRDTFLDFFESKKHLKIQGASIVPNNDPTLLFINSGMAALKPFFTGEKQPQCPDLCNIQPCIRTIDIDDVGDMHHLSFFEMLGSWSINHYFKETAIKLAYELLVTYFQFNPDNLYVSVYAGNPNLQLEADLESEQIWRSLGFKAHQILRLPHEDNFWGPAGDTGPCGPCTEVFFDTQFSEQPVRKVGDSFDTKTRYIEIWNAGVFMQFNKENDGSFSSLLFKSVDTGSGLERMNMVLNGLSSVYQTDRLAPILKYLSTLSNYLSERELRILTDHLRTVVFMLSQGVPFSNDGRGYIPRRLLRKSLSILAQKNITIPFEPLLEIICDCFGTDYPNLVQQKDQLLTAINQETSQFLETLESGLKELKKRCENKSSLSGKDAFHIVSTYGLPYDIIQEYGKTHQIQLDDKAFETAKTLHQTVSRATQESQSETDPIPEIDTAATATQFTGYTDTKSDSTILGIYKENRALDSLSSPQTAWVLLDRSCAYAESGGQIGDTGQINGQNFSGKLIDTQKDKSNRFFHKIQLESGSLTIKDSIQIHIDVKRRAQIRRNHSATHLLQAALQKVLGSQIKQAGSLVTDQRLRFDFHCDQKVSSTDLNQVEIEVIKAIQSNQATQIVELPIKQALEEGATAFFGDKYGDMVRVVNFPGISKECCGGIHVEALGEIGGFRIIQEGSVGRGLRRIQAITGIDALKISQDERDLLQQIYQSLNTDKSKVMERIKGLLEKPKDRPKQAQTISSEWVKTHTNSTDSGLSFLIYSDSELISNPKDLALQIANQIQGVVCLLNEDNKSVAVAVEKGLSSSFNTAALFKSISDFVEVKGGGKPHLMMGSIQKIEGIPKLIQEFPILIKRAQFN